MHYTAQNETATSINFGPVRWMAPESLLYQQFSTASDVWSFAILMWEMANPADRPYPEIETNLQCATQVIRGYRMKTPEYPEDIQRVMTSCWKDDPKERPNFFAISTLLRSR